jgi:O-antigen biosynthesis protein
MKLSVVIVNYNVKYFLEQCLHSVIKAGQGIAMEVFVVDNNSVDGSVQMIRDKFSQIKLMENKENKGFSKANNQAIQQSIGEYILLLNPDTVVEDNTFRQIIDFMDTHSDAGGLGVKMVDGKGHFLPESKRGLPTPAVAFYKIFGFSWLFPKSKTFGRYHLGFLDKNEIHEVEILSGAFMLLRKSVLDKIGMLDESFFMYGEDIDLSYRIIVAGYKNYYFPKARIIHYKGESTRKGSVNYVFVFYNAMMIFARKHFSQKNARLFSFLINLAIFLRASVAVFMRFLRRVFLPAIDFTMIFAGIYFIKIYWESHIKFQSGGGYPLEFVIIAVPVYILIWLVSVLLSGGYDKPIKINKIVGGILVGTVLILMGYALLPENLRYSRALILLGAVWAAASMVGFRYLLNLLNIKSYRFGLNKERRFVIVGDIEEAERIERLLQKTLINPGFIGLINSSEENNVDSRFLGNIHQLADIIRIYQIDEAIFCSKSMIPERIIDFMTELQHTNIDYKIAPPESMSIIGSNSINDTGELYVLAINSISKISNRRSKRLFDVLISISFLFLYPVGIFLVKHPIGFLRNIFWVFFGMRSWVGFHQTDFEDNHKLPSIRKGILNPVDSIKMQNISKEIIDNLNILYAKDYRVINDLNVILKGISNLGRS